MCNQTLAFIRRFSASLLRGGLALLVAAAVFAGTNAASPAQSQRQQLKKLEKNYREWLERDVAYIINKEERDTFLRLTSDEARDKFIERFWEIRNPTPGAATNTYKDEIYERIAYANQYFGSGSGGEGWRTDRGRTYITLGPPAQTEKHYAAANLFPIEIWFYSFHHTALPPFFYVMFYQHEGFGDFRYYSPYLDGPDKLVPGTEAINDRVSSLRMIQESVGAEVAHVALSLIPGEPVDTTTATTSLASDVLLNTIKNLANNPFTKADLNQRRAVLESVTSRLVVSGQYLDLVTLPVRDSRGLTRLDYAVRLKNPADLTVTQREDGRYQYSVEVRVRVFGPDNKLIFTHQKNVSDTFDKHRLAEIKDKVFGFEGLLPLPPGKYRLDLLLTDWAKKTGYQAEKEVAIPSLDANSIVVAGILPFSSADAADPAKADLIPFTLGGVTFSPLSAVPPVLTPEQSLQVAYQIWTGPKNPRQYAGQKLEVEYALGRPAMPGGATVVKDEVSKEQFDPAGSLVNGKKLSLADQPIGNYMLTLTVQQPGTTQRSFGTLNFKVLTSTPVPQPWDIVDPTIAGDAQKGVLDRERGLCVLAQGHKDEARGWFRRALERDHSDDMARARLVEAYYSQKDYAAVVSLFRDAGITDDTDAQTILRMAESLQKSGDTKGAVSLLEEALSAHPDNGPLYLALAGYYESLGNSKKAAELTQKANSYLAPGRSPK